MDRCFIIRSAVLLSLLTLANSWGGEPPAALVAPATRPAEFPFQKEIEAFEAADLQKMPAAGGVLFVGSSSIRLWADVAQDFPKLNVINRGFGGSRIADSVRYAPRIVIPYKPKTIVFYAGDNDIAGGVTPEQVLADFQAFAQIVARDLPGTKLWFISIKPSPSRWKLADKYEKANALIREFTQHSGALGFVDVWTPMLGDDGKPRAELFRADELHMNRKGYDLWRGVLMPLLQPDAARDK